MNTLKVLAALLSYPTEELVAALPELTEVLVEEAVVSPATFRDLQRLFERMRQDDLMTLQEHYVDLFDRVRSLSLHLFEHVHGESRDRGQAMVDLKQTYERHGYILAGTELPDFIPAFLEFLSCIPERQARDLLAETADIIEGIRARLRKRGSLYSSIFETLLGIAGPAQNPVSVTDEEIRDEDDPAVLDALWAEQPAFGPAPECGASARPQVSVVQVHRRRAQSLTPDPSPEGRGEIRALNE